MRVHADKVIKRRTDVNGLNHYTDAKEILCEDFGDMCGYCGKNRIIMREKFHIDHFVPQKVDPDRKNDYYNLVLACSKCNLSKSSKWPTKNKNVSNDGSVGFIDPATEEFDIHMERNAEGYVVGKTELGKQMCKLLNLHIRRSDLYWKVAEILRQQDEMEKLLKAGKLEKDEMAFYIHGNKTLKKLLDEAFSEGE